ncbi:MAG: hypothetical protein KatS3mg110_2509 [Pirellulaceae bacterium]|nr:MAG: hypothetical protein KatS3mg110_2509 [Pirellulaceae bacterium]
MKCTYACGSQEHLLARRTFLGGVVAGVGAVVGGLGALATPSAARQLARDGKRVLVINMHGGLSQLESWDPKPGAPTGGPFRAIPTSVPGIHISELLPKTAQVMHHLALVRGVNTSEDDHGKGIYLMLHGRRQTPAADYPEIGAVVAKALEPLGGDALPGHIKITSGGGGRGNDAAYLGPRYASVRLGDGKPPSHSSRPDGMSDDDEARRQQFRRLVNEHFLSRRRTAMTDLYTYSYEQALQLMEQRQIFDVSLEPQKDQERYGDHAFGRHCLLARRLLEHGITFVQVSHSNYDTHNENFRFHYEQMGEFDGPFATLISDLADRGMLDSTLVVVLSEFGRTPNINQYYGRDHWSRAWSVCLAGAKIARGAVLGKTNENGTAVVDHQVDHAQLFHTYLQAVGIDSFATIDVAGRPVPLADPAAAPIKELLA